MRFLPGGLSLDWYILSSKEIKPSFKTVLRYYSTVWSLCPQRFLRSILKWKLRSLWAEFEYFLQEKKDFQSQRQAGDRFYSLLTGILWNGYNFDWWYLAEHTWQNHNYFRLLRTFGPLLPPASARLSGLIKWHSQRGLTESPHDFMSTSVLTEYFSRQIVERYISKNMRIVLLSVC